VTLKLALRCKPADKFMLVTDAMPSIGSSSKEFMLQGKRISAHGGVCLDSNGTIAGSDLDMATAVRNSVEMLGLSPATAAAMASAAAAAFLGLNKELGAIAAGYRADLVLLDDSLDVQETWIGGQPSSG
jgi:N-acetylglucosamine-6-phosphate deacetylase